MFSSPVYPRPAAHRKSPGAALAAMVAAVLLSLVIALSLIVAPVPASAAAPCRTVPAPAAPIADTPWPQLTYDYPALSQISDGAGVTVAVIDSGVDDTHAQLAGQVLAGADLLAGGGNGRVDCVGHGTAVASIIAARPRSGSGLLGLAPGVKILPIRVTERVEVNGVVTGEGVTGAQLAGAIRTAVAKKAKVINLSLSVGKDVDELRQAVEDALAADVVVVAAVGNNHDRGDPTPYPAAYQGVIGVGAVGQDGVRVPDSQVGSYVDIVAPGAAVTAAVPGRGHTVVQGTSFATPFVTAAAALVRAHRPDLDQAAVARRLFATADPSPGGNDSREYGAGFLNPMRALTELVPGSVARTTPAPPQRLAPQVPAEGSSNWLLAGVAAGLLLAALAVVAVAAAVPMGRRRRWRPGWIAAPTTRGR